jgi:hypothetical protein
MKWELSKVAADSMKFKAHMKRLKRIKANPIPLDEMPVEARRPSIKFVFEQDDYLIWSKQVAMAARGELVPPTMSEWAKFRDQLFEAKQFPHPRWVQTDNRITEEDTVFPQWINVKADDGTWHTELAKWSPREIDDFGRVKPVVEVTQNESRQPVNVDVPDDLYLYEMGCGNRKNESLDHRPMDDRDMRERCITVGNRVYALYEKRKPDLVPRSDLRQEILAKMLHESADYADVDSLVRVFRNMRLSRKAVLKLVHGYVRPDEDGVLDKSSGLKSLDSLEEVALDFEQMDAELAEFDIPEPETNRDRTIDDERAYWLDVSRTLYDRGHFTSILAQIRFIEQSALRDWKDGYYRDPAHVDEYVIYENEQYLTDTHQDIDPDDIDAMVEWDPMDEQTAMAIDANPYSAHPLFGEDSCINDETIDEIKRASWMELSELKSWIMGKDVWYLNSDQRKIVWSFIKGRENELIEVAMKRPIAQMVGSYITETDDSGRACAMLFSWKNGERFDTDEQVFKFDEEGSFENELVAAWTIFRREHKEHQQERRITKNRNTYKFNSYRDRLIGEKGPKRIAVMRTTPLTDADLGL